MNHRYFIFSQGSRVGYRWKETMKSMLNRIPAANSDPIFTDEFDA